MKVRLVVIWNFLVLIDKKVKEYCVTSKVNSRSGIGIKAWENNAEGLLKAMNRLDRKYAETLNMRKANYVRNRRSLIPIESKYEPK